MHRIYALYIALSMMVCNLSALRAVYCDAQMRDGKAVWICNAASDACTGESCKSVANQLDPTQETSDGDCGNPSSSERPCCALCNPNCCQYLVPVLEMPLLSWVAGTEPKSKPCGQQHRYAQSFHPSIWHPPAA